MSTVFANGPGDRGSIPVIQKAKTMVFDATLLSAQYYKVRIKDKVDNPGNGVAPSATSWYNSYWNRSLWVTFDEGRQL